MAVNSVGEVKPDLDLVKTENQTESITDKQTLLAVLQFLKKNNLTGTEALLKKEANLRDVDVPSESVVPSESDVSQALAAYKSEGDPSIYEDSYKCLKDFIEKSLDIHKCELSTVLYPVFVHMYLQLIYNDHEKEALNFYHKFADDQETYYQEDLRQLSTVTKKEHMQGHELMENFKSSRFTIRMSRESYTHLKRHLQERGQRILLNIVQEHLYIDVFDGAPRNKQQIEATSGAMSGESRREANKSKVYYGLLKEPDINIPLDDEDEPAEGEEKPKKKKPKKDPLFLKKSKNDPNAPSVTRIPLPELKDTDKLEKINYYRETMKRMKLAPDCLPSICFYSMLNANENATCITFTEDCSLVSAGFADSYIRVWSLTPQKLRSVKSPSELDVIDNEADDVLERMMDERSATDSKTLVGHSGPIFCTSFSPDKNSLVSSSEDGTVRLWSLLTWTNLVCYKGHNYPVWSVQFSPNGHYFASCGHDRIARMWATDHYQPLRMFAGHLSDVDCQQFHPNSNYIATGSSDRTVRLWDVLNGNCVRIMTGHKGAVHCIVFSPDGRYIASAGVDKNVMLWDIANGELIGCLKGHTDTVYALTFSREGSMLSSGGIDNCIKLWDVRKIFEEQDSEGIVTTPVNMSDNSLLLGSYPTKSTTVMALSFTRRNLLLAAGPYRS